MADREDPLVARVPDDAMVLHIGTHKTGTTALQSALKVRKDELRDLGVTYPLGHRAQHRACMALVEREFGWAEKRPSETYRKKWASFAAKVAPTPGRVLISSEWLCQCSDEQAARAVESLGRERVHVLVAFRALSRILPSSWQQYLKNGWTATYDEPRGDALADVGGGVAVGLFVGGRAPGERDTMARSISSTTPSSARAGSSPLWRIAIARAASRNVCVANIVRRTGPTCSVT